MNKVKENPYFEQGQENAYFEQAQENPYFEQAQENPTFQNEISLEPNISSANDQNIGCDIKNKLFSEILQFFR